MRKTFDETFCKGIDENYFWNLEMKEAKWGRGIISKGIWVYLKGGGSKSQELTGADTAFKRG